MAAPNPAKIPMGLFQEFSNNTLYRRQIARLH
ncbi:hypothetical protein HDF14_003293 [Edaphobacter lichenicola]|uniref:Uncharacterized protein n=1 Tax=Tunturiibacter gelidiferens TaxID=3069689 RepID=A0A9X0QFV1_9BACT|nr:hypothetical protein [Edaphobacter lichenicola]